uniref:RNA helicase n=1 Tax=Hucho hucho TaxID=62062 RepID=A0A4W5QZE9_9TELE
MRKAVEQLDLLRAVEKKDEQVTLTPLGKKMASFPLEPRYAKTILLSPDFQCSEEVLTIVSLLSVDTVLYNPPCTPRGVSYHTQEVHHQQGRSLDPAQHLQNLQESERQQGVVSGELCQQQEHEHG